jgi:hypothetical protein
MGSALRMSPVRMEHVGVTIVLVVPIVGLAAG